MKKLLDIILKILINTTILILILADLIFPGNYKGERDYLLHPLSARSAALGGGSVAVIDNANTVFWNPGGVVFLKGIHISNSNSPYFYTSSGSEYEMSNFAFNANIEKSFIIGLNLQRYKRNLYYPPYRYFDKSVGYLSSSDFYQDSITGILLGFRKGNIGFGINTKFLFTTSASSIAKDPAVIFDFGMLYSNDFRIKKTYPVNFNFGLSVLNISNGVQNESTSLAHFTSPIYKTRLPAILRVGYSFAIKKHQKDGILITHNLEYSMLLNADKNNDRFADYQSLGAGLEIAAYNLIFPRIGYHIREGGDKSYPLYDGITYGIGLNLPIDYIFKRMPVSIKYDFGLYPRDIKSIYKRLNYSKIHSLTINYNF